MVRRLRSLLDLSLAEATALAAALPLVVAVRLALSLLPSALSLRVVRRLATMRPRAPGDPARQQRSVWAVQAVSRYVPAATCLTQAIAGRLLLLRHGSDAELCVGVARDPQGGFRAHAWLERDGRIVIGGDESLSFTRMPGIGIAELAGVGSARR